MCYEHLLISKSINFFNCCGFRFVDVLSLLKPIPNRQIFSLFQMFHCYKSPFVYAYANLSHYFPGVDC